MQKVEGTDNLEHSHRSRMRTRIHRQERRETELSTYQRIASTFSSSISLCLRSLSRLAEKNNDPTQKRKRRNDVRL